MMIGQERPDSLQRDELDIPALDIASITFQSYQLFLSFIAFLIFYDATF